MSGSAKTLFFCKECGNEFPQWSGRCPQCREWDTLAEAPRAARKGRAAAGAGAPGGREAPPLGDDDRARPLPQIDAGEGGARIAVPAAELSRVLGGGLARGSAVLVAGDPGVGKSTLLLELAEGLARGGARCLYASCEESASQTRLRAERLGAGDANLHVLARADLEAIAAETARLSPVVLVVDSIQMAYSPESSGAPGSVSQVRECASRLIRLAKETGTALFLVGHVTKDGAIAGPRVLEHMVDTVLHFEPAGSGHCRQLRAVKNRFGPTDEVAFFEMGARGLKEIAEPSALLLGERGEARGGAAAFPALGGSRVLMVEIQALCAPAAEGYAHRRATGLDSGRLHMLLAVLSRRAGLNLAGCDVFANVAGGLEVAEAAADLPLCAAMASSLREVPISSRLALAGETGLGGELRPLRRASERVREAARHGFTKIIIPRSSARSAQRSGNVEIVGAASLSEALEMALERGS
ncbi:MAG: DNA repair protein RadA [Planctomycetota bacterium]